MVEKLSEELSSLYKTHIPEYLNTLKTAISDKNLVEIRDIAHNLSSAMGSVGDLESGALYKRIEKETLSLKEIKKVLNEAESLTNTTLKQL